MLQLYEMCAHVSVAPKGVDGETIGRLLFLFRSYYLSNFFKTYYNSGVSDENCKLMCLMILKKFGDIGDEYKYSEKSLKKTEKESSKKRNLLDVAAEESANAIMEDGMTETGSNKKRKSKLPKKGKVAKAKDLVEVVDSAKSVKKGSRKEGNPISENDSQSDSASEDADKVGELVEEDVVDDKKKGMKEIAKPKSGERAKAKKARGRAASKMPSGLSSEDAETKLLFEMLKKHNLVVVKQKDE